jgi:hypothetical protein
VWKDLRAAGDAATAMSIADLTLAALSERQPSVTWNDSATTVPGEVSLRNLQPDRLTLAGVTPSEDAHCVGIY